MIYGIISNVAGISNPRARVQFATTTRHIDARSRHPHADILCILCKLFRRNTDVSILCTVCTYFLLYSIYSMQHGSQTLTSGTETLGGVDLEGVLTWLIPGELVPEAGYDAIRAILSGDKSETQTGERSDLLLLEKGM